MIQAIETMWDGYRFRSRLEARWAVFLDALGLDFAYEKEGYDVDGTWYLPDFWIPYEASGNPTWGEWIEIKPVPLEQPQIDLIAGLVRITGHRAIALCGNPWPGEYRAYVFQHHHGGPPTAIPLIDDGVIVESGGEVTEYGDQLPTWLNVVGSKTLMGFPQTIYDWPVKGQLVSAFSAARGARFEHGEKPAPHRHAIRQPVRAKN